MKNTILILWLVFMSLLFVVCDMQGVQGPQGSKGKDGILFKDMYDLLREASGEVDFPTKDQFLQRIIESAKGKRILDEVINKLKNIDIGKTKFGKSILDEIKDIDFTETTLGPSILDGVIDKIVDRVKKIDFKDIKDTDITKTKLGKSIIELVNNALKTDINKSKLVTSTKELVNKALEKDIKDIKLLASTLDRITDEVINQVKDMDDFTKTPFGKSFMDGIEEIMIEMLKSGKLKTCNRIFCQTLSMDKK